MCCIIYTITYNSISMVAQASMKILLVYLLATRAYAVVNPGPQPDNVAPRAHPVMNPGPPPDNAAPRAHPVVNPGPQPAAAPPPAMTAIENVENGNVHWHLPGPVTPPVPRLATRPPMARQTPRPPPATEPTRFIMPSTPPLAPPPPPPPPGPFGHPVVSRLCGLQGQMETLLLRQTQLTLNVRAQDMSLGHIGHHFDRMLGTLDTVANSMSGVLDAAVAVGSRASSSSSSSRHPMSHHAPHRPRLPAAGPRPGPQLELVGIVPPWHRRTRRCTQTTVQTQTDNCVINSEERPFPLQPKPIDVDVADSAPPNPHEQPEDDSADEQPPLCQDDTDSAAAESADEDTPDIGEAMESEASVATSPYERAEPSPEPDPKPPDID